MALAMLPGPVIGDHAQTGEYFLPTSYEWAALPKEILIVPPGHGPLRNAEGFTTTQDPRELDRCTNSYTAAVRNAVQGWRDAVAQFAAPAFASAFTLDLHVLGCDPPETLPKSPEIVVVFNEWQYSVLGVATHLEPCPIAVAMTSSKTPISFSSADMYNIVSHELGHCLGLGHTGDDSGALSSPGGHPDHDLMVGAYAHSVGSPATHRHCASNLNVRGIERAHDGHLDVGEIVRIAVGDYHTSASATCNLRV